VGDIPRMSEEELARYGRMRDSKLNSPVRLQLVTLRCSEPSDDELIGLLAEVITNYTPELVSHVMGTLEDRWAAEFGEAILVARQIRHRGIEPVSEQMIFLLPGFSGGSLSVKEVLFHLADALDYHRTIIRKEILAPMPSGLEKCLFAEALAVAQSVMDREAGDEEVEAYNAGKGPAPTSFQDAWKAKADYYKDTLGAESAEQLAELERAQKADEEMARRRAA
jgi:hypothetical protein